MKIGLLTVATGVYLEYWAQMIASAQSQLKDSVHEITFYVFTDRLKEAKVITKSYEVFRFEIHEIPSYRWPEATLLRYKIIDGLKEQYDEEVLMHLDADMIIEGNFLETINFNELDNGIGLVAHPGFWRPKSIERIRLYLRNPKLGLSDIRNLLLYGGLGTWETSKFSSAYVKRNNRQKYVCGGTWFGLRNNFLSMISICAESVELDLSQGIIAKWHDESHLNKWAAGNKFTLLSPSYCHVPAYPQLTSLQGLIHAIDKTKSN